MLVGVNDKKYNKGIESLYEKIKARMRLNLLVVYDSVLVNKWDVKSVPHIIIVDPAGTVRFITGGRDMTEEKLQDMLAGKNVNFMKKYSELFFSS